MGAKKVRRSDRVFLMIDSWPRSRRLRVLACTAAWKDLPDPLAGILAYAVACTMA
jgi:hypothetical protein